MFLKTLDDIKKFIPEDGKYHDVEIINDNIYIDGELKNQGYVYDIQLFDRALTEDEIKILATDL